MNLYSGDIINLLGNRNCSCNSTSSNAYNFLAGLTQGLGGSSIFSLLGMGGSSLLGGLSGYGYSNYYTGTGCCHNNNTGLWLSMLGAVGGFLGNIGISAFQARKIEKAQKEAEFRTAQTNIQDDLTRLGMNGLSDKQLVELYSNPNSLDTAVQNVIAPKISEKDRLSGDISQLTTSVAAKKAQYDSKETDLTLAAQALEGKTSADADYTQLKQDYDNAKTARDAAETLYKNEKRQLEAKQTELAAVEREITAFNDSKRRVKEYIEMLQRRQATQDRKNNKPSVGL